VPGGNEIHFKKYSRKKPGIKKSGQNPNPNYPKTNYSISNNYFSMKKLVFTALAAMLLNASSMAQVAINTDESPPDNSAMLDVRSTTKGMLVPRITLAQRNAITNPATGLIVYQTDSIPAYYYNSGTSASPAWAMVGSGIGWNVAGNSGTNPVTNFIGTTDAQPLMFKVNNQKAAYIDNYSNTSFGYQCFNSNNGPCNSAFGYQALYSNTTGHSNTAEG
jgi:membrane carboxypeptidase/penicillin-binding protein PbpC